VSRPTVSHHLLYSLDYEVYWTRNDDEVEVLVRPTDHLLAVARDLGVPVTLFVDVMSLWRYAEVGEARFVQAVERQLREAVASGHDVQVHLHPHWMTAERRGAEWRFAASEFLLGAGRSESETYEVSRRLLERARQYLQDLLQPVDSRYEAVAFRAGGYGLQPGARAIIRALVDAGYAIDSSVVPGMYLRTGRNQVDYRRAPDAANYFLDGESGLDAAARDGVFEVPVGAARIGVAAMARRIGRYGRFRLAPPAPLYGRGHSRDLDGGAVSDGGTWRQSIARKGRVLADRFAALRLPEDPEVLLAVTRAWMARHQVSDTYCSLLVHPKGLTGQMVDDLRTYHRRLLDICGADVAFTTFRDAASRLQPGRARATEALRACR